jgi:hypothetical protein
LPPQPCSEAKSRKGYMTGEKNHPDSLRPKGEKVAGAGSSGHPPYPRNAARSDRSLRSCAILCRRVPADPASVEAGLGTKRGLQENAARSALAAPPPPSAAVGRRGRVERAGARTLPSLQTCFHRRGVGGDATAQNCATSKTPVAPGRVPRVGRVAGAASSGYLLAFGAQTVRVVFFAGHVTFPRLCF